MTVALLSSVFLRLMSFFQYYPPSEYLFIFLFISFVLLVFISNPHFRPSTVFTFVVSHPHSPFYFTPFFSFFPSRPPRTFSLRFRLIYLQGLLSVFICRPRVCVRCFSSGWRERGYSRRCVTSRAVSNNFGV